MTATANRMAAMPRRRPDVWLRNIDGEAVLLDPDGRRLHVLNDTALALWEICDGTTTIGEMVEAIVALFRVTEEQAVADVVRVIDQLVDLRIVDMEPITRS